MKNLKYLSILFLTLFALTGCEEDDYELGPINSPSNLQVSVDIVGADDLNPYGDGSGVVNFDATANNASSYEFIINSYKVRRNKSMQVKLLWPSGHFKIEISA